MKTTFTHHPDGHVIIVGVAGQYIATLAEFAGDLAAAGLSAYEGLPEGQRERRYELEQSEGSSFERHIVLSTDSQFAGVVPWAAGREYTAHVGDLLAAQAERLQPIEEEPAPVPEPSLAELRSAKNDEINRGRQIANQGGFIFAGKLIATDWLSRSDIDGVASYLALNGALPPGFPGGWKAVDNTFVPIPDAATFKAMLAAMVSAGTANFLHAQDLKAQLAAATTPEAVEAITWGQV